MSYRQSEKAKATARQYKQRPEVKVKASEYNKRYWRTDAGKARHQRYRETEHYKTVSKEQYRNYRLTLRGRTSLLFAAAKKRSVKQKLPFTITTKGIEQRLEAGVCEVTGMIFNYEVGHPNAPSLDQKIPGNGYTEENTQIVTWWYNRLKSNMTDQQTISLIEEIQKLGIQTNKTI